MFKDLNLQLRDQATYRKPSFALRSGLRMAAAWKIASTMSILTAECLAVNGQNWTAVLQHPNAYYGGRPGKTKAVTNSLDGEDEQMRVRMTCHKLMVFTADQ